jgi:hypothetical protein
VSVNRINRASSGIYAQSCRCLPTPSYNYDRTSDNMAAARSLVKAEELALSGKNESQESQLVLAAYMQEYGIGFCE